MGRGRKVVAWSAALGALLFIGSLGEEGAEVEAGPQAPTAVASSTPHEGATPPMTAPATPVESGAQKDSEGGSPTEKAPTDAGPAKETDLAAAERGSTNAATKPTPAPSKTAASVNPAPAPATKGTTAVPRKTTAPAPKKTTAAPAPKKTRATTAAAGSGASGSCKIKGNINREGEKIYHVPGSRYYDQTKIDATKGERWFCTESEARRAGWRAPKR